MRAILNAWLRRWAEASLRTELHQTQEKLIRQQEKVANVLAHAADQARARAESDATKKKKWAAASSYDTNLIKALRERMPAELFLAVVEHVRAKQKRDRQP